MTDAQATTIAWMARHRDVSPLPDVAVVMLRGQGLPFALVFPDGSYCAARTGDVHEAPRRPPVEGPG